MEHDTEGGMKLPLGVIGRVDTGHLQRELAALDEFMNQAALKDDVPALPRTSKLLEELATDNHVDLSRAKERQQLMKDFKSLLSNAPLLHISFASDPSPAFLRKLLSWIRSEVHPRVLLQIGLQPSIAAGCVVQTRNKYFDLSLRRHFLEQSGELVKRLEVGA